MVTQKKIKKSIESYSHAGRERANNPPVGLVTPKTDPDKGEKRTYAYDPHLDPQLQWAGKAEHTSFDVPTQSLHVHERIDPRTIVEAVRKRNGDNGNQGSLFDKQRDIPLRQEIEFYKHSNNWSNRLIAGDSLLVMNSLLQKENMAGKVQCVYIDPPYGIKYGSNFQPFVNKRDVKDGKDEDLTTEPETIKAFRDTWELGIHSYLSYMRDRLLLARELLAESGSVFVQIGDENVHRVSMIMDDVMGADNRLATISFATTSGSSATFLPQVADYLLWYTKDKEKAKFRQLYEPLSRAEIVGYFNWDVAVELPDGNCRKITAEERYDPDAFLPKGARIYRRTGLDSQGVSTTGRSEPYEWNGRIFHCSKNRQWSISKEGMDRLADVGRLEALKGQNSLMWKKYENEVPGRRINNIWPAQMYPSQKRYVVETSAKAIQRCILMTTDPGDLVFDPTCGSGTTAFVAEQWGRRWITCDTSRVALALARQRLMTATFDYYKLAYPEEGVRSGFEYKSVAYVSPSILADEASSHKIALFDQPFKDTKRARVTGPFTTEAVPAPTVIPIHPPSPSGRGTEGEGSPLTPSLIKQARQLRKQQTDAEQLLWHLLRDNNFYGFKFRRQHPVDPYVLDFYCHEAQLGIELDGGHHNEADQQSKDKKRTAFLIEQGMEVIRFWNNEVLRETEGVLESLHEALTPALSQREREVIADETVARSGETLRQHEWRDELLKTGIRGKSGQRIVFSRVEPIPCRWLHADAETKPDDSGKDEIRDAATAHTPRRAVISFGPEHAPLEQRQVENALQEAATLMPKPEIVVFAAFQFDPEAAKDIDETNWPGVTMLKAQMNADLQNQDLKKKRASNESFWLVGQPDVVVDSEQWIVNSKTREALASYEIIKKLSGVDSLAKINGIDRGDLSLFIAITERRDLWNAVATDAGGRVNSGEYSGGTSATRNGRVSSFSGNSAGLPCRIRDAGDFVSEIEILSERDRRNYIDRLRGNREIADRARQITTSLPDKLSTIHYSQVTIQGFDYFNTKTGELESGDANKIAVWMLDTDYDGRSLYPSQVFFPMADSKGGWAKLAKNLKAEIDEGLIEAYRGTLSLPFEPGQNSRVAVKIVDDRGIESLKVVEIEEADQC